MLYSLLPFFLAVNITVNDVWTHGPEYNFTGYVKMVKLEKEDNGESSGTIVALNLLCRPRVPDILRCYINESNIKLLKPHRDGDINDPRKFVIYNEPFEIKFNERAIDSYIVEKTNPPISPWQLNMIRLIANQFSIGIDLSDRTKDVYTSLENFTTGECDVFSIITRIPTNDVNNSTNLQASHGEFVPLEKLGKLSDETIVITKKRQVMECLRCVNPFFGSRYTFGIYHRNVFSKLKTSESEIFISKQKFRSQTTNENELYDMNRKLLGRVRDTMELNLESYYPAKHPLDNFKNPMIVEVLLDRNGDDKTLH